MSVALLIGALVAQGGVTSSATLPPPIVVAPAPPPPPFIGVAPPIAMRTSSLPPSVVVPVRIRVTGGSQLLFDDTMRIARNAGASFNQNRNEAPERICATQRYFSYGERRSLNVQLSLREDQEGVPAVNVTVSWQRPSGTATCGPDGSRTASLTETVPLKEGQSVTVRGDAGLTVTLSRP